MIMAMAISSILSELFAFISEFTLAVRGNMDLGLFRTLAMQTLITSPSNKQLSLLTEVATEIT